MLRLRRRKRSWNEADLRAGRQRASAFAELSSCRAEYQGGPGFIHGGIIATVLDEAMGKVSRFRAVRAVTAELVVEYLKPVPVDAPLLIEAYEVEKTGRNLHYAGEIRNQSGDLLARGRGRFVVIEPRESRVKDNASVVSDKKIS